MIRRRYNAARPTAVRPHLVALAVRIACRGEQLQALSHAATRCRYRWMRSLTASPTGTVAPSAVTLRLLSDTRLMRLASTGSEAAFAAIFERHHQALHRYCQAILGNGHDAADALQNTMVSVLCELPGETRQIALRAWLYRIAHNEAISLLRTRRRDSDLQVAAHIGDPAAEGVVELRERLRALTADLQQLTEQQRAALLMRELGGLQFSDVACALQVNAAAAKQSVYEARRALQAMEEGRAMDCKSCSVPCLMVTDGCCAR
jgi:RNA polymerase sigma factor (sigma-70 family)